MDNADFREKLFELMKDIDGVTAPDKDKVIQLTKKTQKSRELPPSTNCDSASTP